MYDKVTIKKILKEDVSDKKITKLSVFDFDGTLAYSPEPEQGKPEYKEKTGEAWPYKGWWGREETLDTNIFDIPINPSVVSDYKKEKSDPNTLVVMMTGRITKLSKQVEKILSDNNLSFDYYLYNDGGSTLDFKIKTMDKLLSKYPNIKSVEMWDDRDEHIGPFKAWGSSLDGIDFHINHVK
jgi:hypothetical protein